MDARELAGLELAARADIKWEGTFWLVPRPTGGWHRVSADAKECSCEDFELRGKPCKHMIAVGHVRIRNRGTPVPPAPTADTNVPKKTRKTYKQNWPKYNAAQTSEKRVFQALLADLCGTIEEPTPKKTGRPSNPLRDSVFAAVFKVYSTFSGRRFTTDLLTAQEAGHIDHAPHYNSVFRVLEDARVTPILNSLIPLSALPLRAVETTFAIDSSGFGTSRFVKWFDTKHGTEKRKAEWVKVHICIGTKTHVVTAVEIGNEHDGQHFPTLLETTAETFTIGEVSADKAYLSLKNVELVGSMGGDPFIPPKIGSKAERSGEVWRKMFHLFALNRDEFLAKYHKRSNVESAFSMMKRKFGDAIRSKTDTAMVNESLAKVLCHNLSVLVHEMEELGINPQFGGRKPTDEVTGPRLYQGA